MSNALGPSNQDPSLMPGSPLDREATVRFQNEAYEQLVIHGQEQDIVSGQPVEVDGLSKSVLDHVQNDQEGISQDLLGVLALGGPRGEKIAIVRTGEAGQKKIILSRFATSENERATLIGAIEPGTTEAVGRVEDEGDKKGNGFSDFVSRKHLNITVTPDSRVVIDELGSMNGTKLVTAHQGKGFQTGRFEPWAAKSASVHSVFESKAPEANDTALITKVPLGEVVEKVPVSKEQVREAMLKDIDARIENQEGVIRGVEEGLSEDDRNNLWRYASGTINKAEAQSMGQGQESINQGQIAGQALRDLSPKARTRADDYLYAMQIINSSYITRRRLLDSEA